MVALFSILHVFGIVGAIAAALCLGWFAVRAFRGRAVAPAVLWSVVALLSGSVVLTVMTRLTVKTETLTSGAMDDQK